MQRTCTDWGLDQSHDEYFDQYDEEDMNEFRRQIAISWFGAVEAFTHVESLPDTAGSFAVPTKQLGKPYYGIKLLTVPHSDCTKEGD